jgi:hypothetical protein
MNESTIRRNSILRGDIGKDYSGIVFVNRIWQILEVVVTIETISISFLGIGQVIN